MTQACPNPDSVAAFPEIPMHQTITRILKDSAYTPNAVQEVMPLVYEELRRLAAHFLKSERGDHTLNATALVHEAYVRLFGLEQMSFNDRRHFFSTAAMAMRRILVEHERKRRAGTRIPAARLEPVEPNLLDAESADKVDLLALDRALEKLAQLSPRQARVIELRYFAGLTEHQIAEVLEISRPTVARDMRTGKLWLRREMRS